MTVSFSPHVPDHVAARGKPFADGVPNAAPGTSSGTTPGESTTGASTPGVVIDISAEAGGTGAPATVTHGMSAQSPAHLAKALVDGSSILSGDAPTIPFGHIVSAIARTGDASHLFATPEPEEPAVEETVESGATGGGETAPVEETVESGATGGGETAPIEAPTLQVGEPDLEGALLDYLEEGVDLVA